MARRTILIIDDTADHRAMLRRLLQSVGYHVVEASSSAEALRAAQHHSPDLVLAALSLPGQHGWEAAQQLRTQPVLADTPILGTTVYNTLLKPSRARAVGYADCVEKPFDLDDLLHRIQQHLPEPSHAAYA